jgi:hypothetical protein
MNNFLKLSLRNFVRFSKISTDNKLGRSNFNLIVQDIDRRLKKFDEQDSRKGLSKYNYEKQEREIKSNSNLELRVPHAQHENSLESGSEEMSHLEDRHKYEKKILQVHPKKIPDLKLNQIYSYDTVQLLESLKYLEYKKSNINKFINILSVIRRKRDVKIYDFPEILSIISFIKNNLESLQPSYTVSFLYSLAKMQNFDPKRPSLNNQKLIIEILDNLMGKLNQIELRGISNIVYSLHSLQLKNPEVYNFTEFFNKLEEVIILKISKHRNQIKTQDITNIILSYCKTQNGSEEFYRILQNLILIMQSQLTSQDLAVVLYSYANNPTCLEKLLEDLEEKVRLEMKSFKPKELCSILRAYDKRNLLKDDFKQLFIDTIIEKHELINSTDLVHFYDILCESNDKFLKYAHNCIRNLYFTFSDKDLEVIFKRADFILQKDKNIYELLKKQVLKIMKKNEISGFELKRIYENTKDLPFDGQYNTFIEALEKKLEELKYY